jgi:hypothetical protein
MLQDERDPQLSELERELELEMDDSMELEADDDLGRELEEDPEAEYEEPSDSEYEEDSELEGPEEGEGGYAQRFYELSDREFESEAERDAAIDGLLGEMEREYFFGGLLKKAKNAAKRLAKKGLSMAMKAGMNLPAFQALKAVTGLSGNLLKGNLGALAKSALKTALSAHPAGAVAMQALGGLGFEAGQDEEAHREAWDNFTRVARESFEVLAETMHENADSPLEASRLAGGALQQALRRARVPMRAGGAVRLRAASAVRGARGPARVVAIYPGERVLIVRRKRR